MESGAIPETIISPASGIFQVSIIIPLQGI